MGYVCKANFYDGSKVEGTGATKHWLKGEEYTGNNEKQLLEEGLIGKGEAETEKQDEEPANTKSESSGDEPAEQEESQSRRPGRRR